MRAEARSRELQGDGAEEGTRLSAIWRAVTGPMPTPPAKPEPFKGSNDEAGVERILDGTKADL